MAGPTRLTENFQIVKGEKHKIPKGANIIGAKNGKAAFFKGEAKDCVPDKVSRQHWRYWWISQNGNSKKHHVCFKNFEKRAQGWVYGYPDLV